MPEKGTAPWASWQECALDDECAVDALEGLASLRPEFFSGGTDLVSCRRSDLSFYSDTELLDLEVVHDDGVSRVFFLDSPEVWAWLYGESEPIHDANERESLALTESTVADYLRFFLYFVRGDHGAFVLIESADEVEGDDSVADQHDLLTLEDARSYAHPLTMRGLDESGRWLIDAVVAYDGVLFNVSFTIEVNGLVEMAHDHPLGGLGELVTPEPPSLELEEQDDDSSLEDSESSDDSDDSESSDDLEDLDADSIARVDAILAQFRGDVPWNDADLDRLLGKGLGAGRLDSRQSTSTALQAAADELPQRKREWQQVIDHVWNTANQILEGFADSHPDIGNMLVQLDAAQKELNEAYQARTGSGLMWDLDVNPSSQGSLDVGPLDPKQWISVARKLTTDLRTEPVPWTKKGRHDQHMSFGVAALCARNSYKPTIRELAVDAWHRMRVAGGEKAQVIVSTARDNGPKYFAPSPPIGPRSDPMDPGKPEIVGHGPLNFYLGYLVSQRLSFTTTSYGNYETSQQQYEVPHFMIPVVIDLDVTGGLLVDDPHCIEGSVLNLLSALPANQFLLKIFDPEHGGDSAKYLFGLGDAGERIIGDRIKTSDRELDELLQSTEEHITLVTQKFLQGEHQSLTEYNRAAGEVAEAYQLMVLYDFPAGFQRGGRYDDDQLDRLSKIIRNGPRTGVFTILVTDSATPDALLKQSGEPIADIVGALVWFLSGRGLSPRMHRILGSGPDGLKFWTTVDAPEVSGAVATVSQANLTWRFQPADPPSEAVAASQLNAVKRNIHSARDVQVTPQRVAQLADQMQRSDSEAFGQQYTPTVAYPDQPDTWWRASSERAVAAHFGQLGARQVADLIFSSEVNSYSALIGGRPGSGKSVLIHSVIMSIATEYAPGEVELYLIDFKEGVEFKQYADTGLPHARVIAIESERDFGLSVLQRVRDEIRHRGDLFKSGGGGDTVDLAQYRARTGQPLKRLVLIIDEFQQLFYRDDAIARDSAEIVEDILKRGRAFGIHLLLATQTVAGMATLGRHVLGLIPTRIALQSSESDSRLILGEDNPDADSLARAGEGILNRKGGHKDANERFQSAYWDSDARGVVLEKVVSRARSQGCPEITTVFEGHKPADITAIDARSLIPVGDTGVAIPVGLPLTLDPQPLFARLRRESGSNLLIVDEHGAGTVAVAVSSLCQQGAVIDLLDFVGEDDDWDTLRDEVAALPGVTIHGRRAMVEAISNLLTAIDQRESLSDYKDKPRVLVIAGMDRARDFDPEDSYNDEAPSHILGRILRDGPDVGVFVLAWFSRPPGVKKRLERQLAEFGQRLVTQANRDDSSRLIDSDSAAGLKPGQGVLAHVDRGTEYKIRTFSAPSAKWFGRFNAGARTG